MIPVMNAVTRFSPVATNLMAAIGGWTSRTINMCISRLSYVQTLSAGLGEERIAMARCICGSEMTSMSRGIGVELTNDECLH